MTTPKKMMSAAARGLAASAILVAATSATAGPVGTVANSHRVGSAPHLAVMSLAALRPNLAALSPSLAMAPRPQMSLDAPRASALSLHEATPRLPTAEGSVAATHSPQGLHWEDASAPVNPHLISLARNYHHDGLPVVKLWQAERNMVSIGLNPHGVPGIFFTQTMGK